MPRSMRGTTINDFPSCCQTRNFPGGGPHCRITASRCRSGTLDSNHCRYVSAGMSTALPLAARRSSDARGPEADLPAAIAEPAEQLVFVGRHGRKAVAVVLHPPQHVDHAPRPVHEHPGRGAAHQFRLAQVAIVIDKGHLFLRGWEAGPGESRRRRGPPGGRCARGSA